MILWVWGCLLAAALAPGLAAEVDAPLGAESLSVAVPAPLMDAGQEPQALEPSHQEGLATWYGGKRWHGRRTASGERFDRYSFTAAHKTLPMGSIVRVVNQHNGREVQVRINDRGPYAKNRIIDLSEAAAEQLGMLRAGRALVRLHRNTPNHQPDPAN